MELKLYFGVRQQMRFGRDGRFSHYRVRGFYCSAEAAPAQTVTADGRHVVVVNFFCTREAADEHAAEKASRKRAKV